jgi:hypothetical protein
MRYFENEYEFIEVKKDGQTFWTNNGHSSA